MPYINLALAMVAVYFPYQTWAINTLVVFNLIFASLFYWLCMNTVSGFVTTRINTNIDLARVWLSRIVQMFSVFVMYKYGGTYALTAMFILPWIVIATTSDSIATLVKWEILGIVPKE
jgi:hypothetical protein